MDLRSVQKCINSGVMTYIRVHSQSDPRKSYDVLVQDPIDPSESICECEGFEYRGRCSHQNIAHQYICGWEEISGPEEQNSNQRKQNICPRCSGETETELVDLDG